MAGSSSSELRTLVFNGENYEFWSIRMKTIMKSHGLWDLVENGFDASDPTKKKGKEEGSKAAEEEKSTSAEILMKDARALGLIQGAVSDQIFPRIVNEETSKGAWDILKQEFRGDKQVQSVKLQGLRREFEYTRMKDSESFSGYVAKLFDLINQMKSYGEGLPRERVVQKLLISLPRSYDSICSVIEHSKDLDTLEIQEVVASLKNFELRLDRHTENSTEKSFTSLNIESKSSKNGSSSGGNKSQKNWKENGKNWNNKSNSNPKPNASNDGTKTPCKHCEKLHYGKCWFEGKPKCRGCGKFGHMVRNCHENQPVQKVNYANQVEVTGTLFYACNAVTDVKLNNSWYVDSGCSNHMTGDERLLIDIRRDVTSKVKMGTGETVQVAGKGTLVMETKIGRKHIQEVMLVPGLEENLLSVGQMMEHGCFSLTMVPATQLVLRASVTHSLQTWHKRLGHLNDQSIRMLANQDMVHGLPSLEKDFAVCEGCKLGKQHRDSFPAESTWRAQFPLELVHTDICGPMQIASMSENRYFLLFIDDYTRMAWVYFLINKSNAFECFKKFKAMTELQSGHKVKSLRSDRGGEFMSNEFLAYCSEAGIQRQLTVAYSPQQNGVVERKNRTVIEMAKSMLHEKSLPYEFWAEAVHTTVYLLNRCPSKSLKKMTPFEAYTGRKPSYRLYDPKTTKIILSRDVYFDEEASWKWENPSNADVRMPMPDGNQGTAETEQRILDEQSQFLDTQMQMEEEIAPQGEEMLDETQSYFISLAGVWPESKSFSDKGLGHVPKESVTDGQITAGKSAGNL
ncbi:hypothetical protein L3X38_004718 [Prunus dulcis]|uniref:Uncharacterized protein n=1 Tax=Prunus dulcis TaxID=3755 RepID=A0AAD5F3F1_PRUDU|nr:hypothetical protein L3X38_004718 [Prunus dulcis]